MYPEINVQISAAAELAVADLEGHGHFIVGVELFVEALAHVRFELDVVGGGDIEKEGEEDGEEEEQHLGRQEGLASTEEGMLMKRSREREKVEDGKVDASMPCMHACAGRTSEVVRV